MRIRSTKPEFWRSKTIAALSWEVRLVLKGLESYVDDNGVGKDDIALIAADVFPRDLSANPRDTLARLTEAISGLSDGGLVVRYEINGEGLLYVDRWKDLQRIDKPGKGRFPRPDGTLEYSEPVNRDSYTNTPETLASPPETLAPVTGEQGNRGAGEQHASRAAAGVDDEPPSDDDYVPDEIENAARPHKPQKPSSTELSFIRLHIGQQLPRPVEQSLINEVRKLRTYETPVIEEALRMWAGRPDARPGLLPHLVTDVLKRPHAKPQGGESKADIWTTSVIDPADQAATDQQRKLA